MDELLEIFVESFTMSRRRWLRTGITIVLGAICIALLTMPLWAQYL